MAGDDTEGHRLNREDMAGDDTEGHRLNREDMAGDDTEGHITPPSRVQPEH
jgi:hypothetical protein